MEFTVFENLHVLLIPVNNIHVHVDEKPKKYYLTRKKINIGLCQ